MFTIPPASRSRDSDTADKAVHVGLKRLTRARPFFERRSILRRASSGSAVVSTNPALCSDTPDTFLVQRRRLMGAGFAALALPAVGKRRSDHSTTPDALDTFIAEQMRRANIPGLAVGLAREGGRSLRARLWLRRHREASACDRRYAVPHRFDHEDGDRRSDHATRRRRTIDAGRAGGSSSRFPSRQSEPPDSADHLSSATDAYLQPVARQVLRNRLSPERP